MTKCYQEAHESCLQDFIEKLQDLNDITIKIKVTPKAKSSRIKKDKDLYKVYVTEPAKNGKANKAVIELIAKQFGVSKSNVIIKSGLTSREKIILIKAN
ncbi:DUF167 domain-containing protein [Candidatus Cytomitobacter indipagum]|uniref:UPF0235 protein FZC35_01410 n=2 Tax=Candidatus Cytomitobacter indipagum TaxID=2601575 RepID=A0A5C0UF12_9PROT|nr:DUF167 domain-containing protein [Candidatus Cytomitobacter indipagum]